VRSQVAAAGLAGCVALAGLAACSTTDAGYSPGPADARSAERGASPSSGPGNVPRGLVDPTATRLRPYADARWPAYIVSPRHSSLTVRGTPNGPVTRTMKSRLVSGAPLKLLLVGRQPGWLRVELPVRPNGSTGWVRERDTWLAGVRYRLDVLRGEHELRLYSLNRLVRTYPVGIGKDETPTPGGLYYLIELLRPPDPGGPYGPYAFGLSGFSTVLHHFAGGNGVIGLHGTNDPSSIGADVSHGCIRMHNADIKRLAKLLPLGTPVRILA
jgi:L,D-transpeptidase catalytic domain